jgi:hypothetical protein
VLAWLLGAAVGPATVAVPVNWAAEALASAARRWFRRLRRTDDLSRLVRAATGTSVGLAQAEFDAVRRLMEDQQTWSLLGHGTVEDLASRIASCLPSRDGRTAEDSHTAALTIARGLLEFAVRDLDPKVFQQVLLARLQRIETDQASALDEALLDLHVDLIARFTSVIGHLDRVLDLLPPGPAHRGEIAVYLTTLIDWLSTDQWPRDRLFEPQDRRFEQPALTPAALERKLRMAAMGQASEQDFDANDLAKRCRRLVVLGRPGSGKTWLAKRTVRRCAEDALEALAAGRTLDEIELPLYTTCSHLFGADGDIRHAVVSSALDQLGDLGGSRLSAALRVFSPSGTRRLCWSSTPSMKPMVPASGSVRPTHYRGGSFSRVGGARGTISSLSRRETTPNGSVSCSRCATPAMSSPLSTAGSPADPSGETILLLRSRGVLAFSRPLPCR